MPRVLRESFYVKQNNIYAEEENLLSFISQPNVIDNTSQGVTSMGWPYKLHCIYDRAFKIIPRNKTIDLRNENVCAKRRVSLQVQINALLVCSSLLSVCIVQSYSENLQFLSSLSLGTLSCQSGASCKTRFSGRSLFSRVRHFGLRSFQGHQNDAQLCLSFYSSKRLNHTTI